MQEVLQPVEPVLGIQEGESNHIVLPVDIFTANRSGRFNFSPVVVTVGGFAVESSCDICVSFPLFGSESCIILFQKPLPSPPPK